jgi:hypothetical protein
MRENYQPSQEEIKKAEDLMTDNQKDDSKKREEMANRNDALLTPEERSVAEEMDKINIKYMLEDSGEFSSEEIEKLEKDGWIKFEEQSKYYIKLQLNKHERETGKKIDFTEFSIKNARKALDEPFKL